VVVSTQQRQKHISARSAVAGARQSDPAVSGRSITRMSSVYDLLVIGSGPAGQRAAIYASKLGKKVALVEMREVVGGACINTGTIPSKTMREAVLHLSGYNYKSIYGMNYRVKERITMADLAFRVQHVIKTEIDVTEAQLQRNNIEMLVGVASFVDQNHIKVTNSRGESIYEAKNILIATGTKPAASAKVPINGKSIINSDLVLDLVNLPKTMIVVGGGVIGVEYTCMFSALGVRVTLIERRPRLLEFADQEIVEALSYHLRDSRVTMRLNEEVESVEEMPDGTVVANLESKKKLQGDALLYAVGRQGNVDELNLGAVGIESDSRGRIPVDKDFATKVPHIYAVGDVIGFPSLASVSMEQGRIASARAFGDESVISNPSFYPYGILTIPEISFLGKTEEQLTEEDVPYEVGVAYYREIARGQIRGDTTGRLKLIFHRVTHALLGVHIIGEGASELVHIGQAVMALGGKLDYFVETVFNYPTLAECYKVAAFNGLNRVSKFE
jgi:NAD(P) transhydrogenase